MPHLIAAAASAVFAFFGEYRLAAFGAAELPLLGLIAAHAAYGGFRAARRRRFAHRRWEPPIGAEVLLAAAVLLFLFTYIYAANANLDYVRWFQLTSGNLNFAIDSSIERRGALLRFLPLLAAGLFALLRPFPAAARAGVRRVLPAQSFFLASLSALALCLSLPSFASVQGFGALAWIALVPFFVAVYLVPGRRAFFCGLFFGLSASTLVNYWLGTFSLISLQIFILIQAVYFAGFMAVYVPVLKAAGRFRWLAAAVGWTAFEFVRSLGFLGYPWCPVGTSQYEVLPLIQIASVTGVWGVSFLVVLVNAVLADLAARAISGRAERRGGSLAAGPAVAATALGLTLLWGQLSLATSGGGGEGYDGAAAESSATVALIQQNSDPRKDDYEATFEALKRLSLESLSEKPDLVVWAETAFVPNIRRWSEEDPEKWELARLVHRMLDFQRGMGTWLLTGNDDYEDVREADGTERRNSYNAAVLFSSDGRRMDTYHKIRLVPFTEYFPYKEELPWFYELLLAFDVHLWEPGATRTIFRHPLFDFATPICFEGIFPSEVRAFVRNGAEVIINISNDYWSLTETQARQHFVSALFRAVENRRHLLRGTVSGLTAHVDPWGRILVELPAYTEGFVVTRVPTGVPASSFYTAGGDWFPLVCLAGFVIAAFGAAVVNLSAVWRRRRRAVAVERRPPNRRDPPRS